MKKRTQKSQQRTKFLFVLIILTAILSITATYAWFSTRRDVEIANLEVKIESAENLQISLDGEKWSQTITIENMKQLYGTHTDATGLLYQAKANEHANYIPTELLPISTVGTLGTGATGDEAKGVLKFVSAEIDGDNITKVEKCSEADVVQGAETSTKEGNNAKHPYLVFEVYLRNLSRRSGETYQTAEVGTEVGGVTVTNAMVGQPKPDAYDPLVLGKGSRVWIESGEGVTGTGLENTARIAFVPLGGTANLTETGANIRDLAADGTERVSIWEPNSKEHTTYVVQNNDRGITAAVEEYTTTAIKDTATASVASPISAKNPGTTNGTAVHTVKAAYDSTGATTAENGDNLICVDGSTQLSIKPNQISKVKVYLWIEGQDVDCVDLASTGKQLNATIKILKPEYTPAAGGGNSYQ